MNIKPRYLLISLAALTFITIWGGGLIWFANKIPTSPQTVTQMQHTDAIVVLTGGAKRVSKGIELLQQQIAPQLFISGIGAKTTHHNLNLPSDKTLYDHIMLGYLATNTKENAEETRIWMDLWGYETMYLVTSSYHMPRSMLEFTHIMPHKTILPYPVNPEGIHQENHSLSWRTIRLIISEYHKYLFITLQYSLTS